MRRLTNWFTKNKAIVLIVLLAALLRFYALDFVPPALNWDEVSHGYNAYSILKTGKDEWGESLPRVFRAFGDYKLPVYIYATVPSVAIFGLTPIGVRLASVLSGIASVFLVYLLVQKLFGQKTISFLAALFMALEPWSFFLSRVAVEANLSLFLVIAGVWFFLEGFKRKWFLVISALLFGLSVWTYNSARIFVPLLLVFLSFLYKKELLSLWKSNRKLLIFNFVLLTLFFVPMFWQLANPVGLARYGWVQILDEGARASINEARAASTLPSPLAILVHNKATFFVTRFATNYISHSSPEFLFFKGGSHFQFNIPGKGLLYPIELPFILLGLFWLLRRKDKPSILLFAWLLLAPIPSSLTREAPHALRAILMQPVPQIVAAIGLVAGWEWLKNNSKLKSIKYLFIGIYVVALLYFAEGYLTEYVTRYRENYSWAWQYGYKETIQEIKQRYSDYDQIFFTKKYGEPHEFVLFFWPWDPQTYINDPNLERYFRSNWYWVDAFDKFRFVNDWEVQTNVNCQLNLDCLLVTSPGNVPRGWQHLKTLNFLDGNPAFELYEKVS